jgi:hypothetical protein
MRCSFHDAGLQCATYTPGQPYCPAHASQPGSPRSSPPAESEVAQNTTSSRRFCFAVRDDDGGPCQAPPRSESHYCIFHDPDYDRQHLANARLGGEASGRARQPIRPWDVLLYVGNAEGVQAVLDNVVRLELLGRISPARSRNILRALSVASRNVQSAAFDTRQYSKLAETLADMITEATDEAATATPLPNGLPLRRLHEPPQMAVDRPRRRASLAPSPVRSASVSTCDQRAVVPLGSREGARKASTSRAPCVSESPWFGFAYRWSFVAVPYDLRRSVLRTLPMALRGNSATIE